MIHKYVMAALISLATLSTAAITNVKVDAISPNSELITTHTTQETENTEINFDTISEAYAQEMLAATVRIDEGSMLSQISKNPDLNLSAQELADKYKNYCYEGIRQEYEFLGYSEEDFNTIIAKCPELDDRNLVTLSESEKELFYRLVYSEGGNQPYETQRYIASVVINRMYSPRYPNTIHDVIYQPYQFEVCSNGMVDRATPTQTTIDAVNDVLKNGVSNAEILYFRNSYYHIGQTAQFVSGILYFSS